MVLTRAGDGDGSLQVLEGVRREGGRVLLEGAKQLRRPVVELAADQQLHVLLL